MPISFVVRIVDFRKNKASIIALRRKVFVEEKGLATSLVEDPRDNASRHVVVSCRGQVVGVGSIARDGFVSRVAVLQKFRRLGIGSMVMGGLHEVGLLQGNPVVHLTAFADAVGFYLKLGYESCRVPVEIDGIIQYKMKKSIGNSVVFDELQKPIMTNKEDGMEDLVKQEMERYMKMFSGGKGSDLIELGEKRWGKFLSRHRNNVFVSECCRLVMQAHYDNKEYGKGDVWKARFMASAILSNNTNALIAILLTGMFSVLAKSGAKEALSVMDEVSALIPAVKPNRKSMHDMETLSRLCHEKRGFLLVELKKYREAVKEYKTALGYTSSPSRGWFKVSLGLELAKYLANTTMCKKDKAIDSQKKLIEGVKEIGDVWILERAKHNLRFMEGQGLEKNYIPYETL